MGNHPPCVHIRELRCNIRYFGRRHGTFKSVSKEFKRSKAVQDLSLSEAESNMPNVALTHLHPSFVPHAA